MTDASRRGMNEVNVMFAYLVIGVSHKNWVKKSRQGREKRGVRYPSLICPKLVMAAARTVISFFHFPCYMNIVHKARGGIHGSVSAHFRGK